MSLLPTAGSHWKLFATQPAARIQLLDSMLSRFGLTSTDRTRITALPGQEQKAAEDEFFT
jgi:hypothetical protein